MKSKQLAHFSQLDNNNIIIKEWNYFNDRVIVSVVLQLGVRLSLIFNGFFHCSLTFSRKGNLLMKNHRLSLLKYIYMVLSLS